MCLLNKMIVELSTMTQTDEVNLQILFEKLTNKKYSIEEVCSTLDMDYIQVYNVFEAKTFNAVVIRKPHIHTVANAITMLTIYKICGVTTWEKVENWQIETSKLFETINDLSAKITSRRRSS